MRNNNFIFPTTLKWVINISFERWIHVHTCSVEFYFYFCEWIIISLNVNIVDIKKDLFVSISIILCHFKITFTIREKIWEDPIETKIKACEKRANHFMWETFHVNSSSFRSNCLAFWEKRVAFLVNPLASIYRACSEIKINCFIKCIWK